MIELKVLISPVDAFRSAPALRLRLLRRSCCVLGIVTVLAALLLTIYSSQVISSVQQALSANQHLSAETLQDLTGGIKMAKFLSLSTVVVQALIFPLCWILGTAIIAAFSVLSGGAGKFRELAPLTGFGFVPYIIFLCVAICLVIALPLNIDTLAISVARDQKEFIEALKDYKMALNNSVLVLLLLRFNAVFTVWVVLLWGLALQQVEGFSAWKSRILVSCGMGFMYICSHIAGWFA